MHRMKCLWAWIQICFAIAALGACVPTPDSGAPKESITSKSPQTEPVVLSADWFGWDSHFPGTVFGRYSENPAGYLCGIDESPPVSFWSPLPAPAIYPHSGNGIESIEAEPIHQKGFGVVSWDFVLEDVEEPYEDKPRALVVAYRRNYLDENYLEKMVSKVLVYRDLDGDGLIENDESVHELTLPANLHPETLLAHKNQLYIRAAKIKESKSQWLIVKYADSGSDGIPDKLDDRPSQEIKDDEAVWDGEAYWRYSHINWAHGKPSDRHLIESSKQYALQTFIDPPKKKAEVPFHGSVYFQHTPLAGDNFVWLDGPPLKSYVVATESGDLLGKGWLDSKGFAKAMLSRKLIEDESIQASVVANEHPSWNVAYDSRTPVPMPDEPVEISVGGEKSLKIKGRNFTKDMRVLLCWGWDESWECKTRFVSSTEVLIDTPDISKSMFPDGRANLRFNASFQSDWGSERVAIKLKQIDIPTITEAEIWGTQAENSLSIGKSESLYLKGRNINAHTRADLLYQDQEISLGLHYRKESGISGSIEIPKLLGRIPASVEFIVAIRGKSQTIAKAQRFTLRTEAIAPLSIQKIESKVLPTGGDVIITGKGMAHSTGVYYRDAAGVEHLLRKEGYVGSSKSDKGKRSFAINPLKGQVFPPNAVIKLLLRDIAENGPGVAFEAKVGDFESSNTKWLSTKEIAADGGTRITMRGGPDFKPYWRMAVIEHNGKSYRLELKDPRKDGAKSDGNNIDLGLFMARECYLVAPKLAGAKSGDVVTLWIRHELQTAGGDRFELQVK